MAIDLSIIANDITNELKNYTCHGNVNEVLVKQIQ